MGGGFLTGVGCVDSLLDREVSMFIGMVLLTLAAIASGSNLQHITKRASRDERLENGYATESEVSEAALWLSQYAEGPYLVDHYAARRTALTDSQDR
jgi:hypothetical protein